MGGERESKYEVVADLALLLYIQYPLIQTVRNTVTSFIAKVYEDFLIIKWRQLSKYFVTATFDALSFCSRSFIG